MKLRYYSNYGIHFNFYIVGKICSDINIIRNHYIELGYYEIDNNLRSPFDILMCKYHELVEVPNLDFSFSTIDECLKHSIKYVKENNIKPINDDAFIRITMEVEPGNSNETNIKNNILDFCKSAVFGFDKYFNFKFAYFIFAQNNGYLPNAYLNDRNMLNCFQGNIPINEWYANYPMLKNYIINRHKEIEY